MILSTIARFFWSELATKGSCAGMDAITRLRSTSSRALSPAGKSVEKAEAVSFVLFCGGAEGFEIFEIRDQLLKPSVAATMTSDNDAAAKPRRGAELNHSANQLLLPNQFWAANRF